MCKSIVITGASGFVGINICNYLNSTYNIIEKSVRYKINQVFDFNSDAIIHLAGKAHDLKKTSNDAEYFEVNYELTKQLYNHFLKSRAKKFIYISSVKAAADIVDGVLDEEVIPNPITVYGKSKLKAEEYILQNLPKDKEVYILRPCMIHGPGNKGNLNLLYSIVAKGIPYPLGAYQNERSFLSVANLCFIIEQLLQKRIPSGVYNVADDGALSTSQIVSLVGDSLGNKAAILNTPKFIIKSIAKIGDVLPLPINSERLQKLTENYVVSNSKIKKALQVELPLTAIDGLFQTFQSFKK